MATHIVASRHEGASLGPAVLWCTFAFALAIRVAVIWATPNVNYHNTDLEIYRLGGQLVHAGVNPYDVRAGVEIRARLREASVSPTLRLSQSWWDYWTSSNLPLNLLVLGAIDFISHDPRWYRFAFALADSLYAVLIMRALFAWWPNASRLETIVSGAALGAASLVMLQWGVRIPEEKGIQLLLMTGALVLVVDERRTHRVVFSACCLGLSVAFKALGIWLLPLCLFMLWTRNNRSRSDIGFFLVVFTWSTFVWFLPYVWQVGEMVRTRVAADVSMPGHASPFTWVFPRDWILTIDHYSDALRRTTYARLAMGMTFICLTGFGLLRRRISVEVATAVALMGFVSIILVAGSVDRMNIAFVTAILLIGAHHSAARRIALGWYTVLGLVSFVTGTVIGRFSERSESFVIGIGLLLMLGFLIDLSVRKRRPSIQLETERRIASDERPGRALSRLQPVAAAIVTCMVLTLTALSASPRRQNLTPEALTWQSNPFVGTWHLNIGRSKFANRFRIPKNETRRYKALGDGMVRETVRRIEADDTFRAAVCWLRYDQRPYAVVDETSRRPIGDVVFTRINEYIIDFAGRIAESGVTGVMKTSVDGQTLTIDISRMSADGEKSRDEMVYDRK